MEFLLLITHDDAFVPTAQLMEDIRAWDREMDARGLRRDGRPLRPPAEAVTVRVREGARAVTAGPAAAGFEQTAAYELLECDSLEDALEAAAAHPMAAAGAVEVRPVWEALRDGEAMGRRTQARPTVVDAPRGKAAGTGPTR